MKRGLRDAGADRLAGATRTDGVTEIALRGLVFARRLPVMRRTSCVLPRVLDRQPGEKEKGLAGDARPRSSRPMTALGGRTERVCGLHGGAVQLVEIDVEVVEA